MTENLRDFLANYRSFLAPIALAILMWMSLMAFGYVTILPQWQVYTSLDADAANQRLAAAQHEQIMAEQGDLTVLRAQVDSARDDLYAAATGLLTTAEAESILTSLYTYSKDSGVTIIALQSQPIEDFGAYRIRAFHLQVRGSVLRLMDLLKRMREASVPGVAITDLSITSGEEDATMNATVSLYTSPYAPGETFATLEAPLPPYTENTGSETQLIDLEVDSTLAALLIDARFDLQLLAMEQLGTTLPDGWRGSTEIEDPQFHVLLRLDLELLVGTLLGAEVRPGGWRGAQPGTVDRIVYDIRHDLELLADTLHLNMRPPSWRGSSPLRRCDESTQALVRYLERHSEFLLQANPDAADFCVQASSEAWYFAQVNTSNGIDDMAAFNEMGFYVIENDFVVAFLDRSGSQRAGVIPEGAIIAPVARSYTQFSNMMLVTGHNYSVYVDYVTTPVTPQTFWQLPDVNDTPYQPLCETYWCDLP